MKAIYGHLYIRGYYHNHFRILTPLPEVGTEFHILAATWKVLGVSVLEDGINYILYRIDVENISYDPPTVRAPYKWTDPLTEAYRKNN